MTPKIVDRAHQKKLLNSVLIEGIVTEVSAQIFEIKTYCPISPTQAILFETTVNNGTQNPIPKVGSRVRIIGRLSPSGIIAEHIELSHVAQPKEALI